jgi:prophage DNA circulation protein
MFDNTCPSPDYLEFSYQGFPLWLHNSQLTVNKGAAQSDIYGRNSPVTTDTGNKAESFSFTCMLYGEGIQLQENALRLAAQAPMPHALIHPSFGLMLANVHSVEFNTDYKSSLGVTTVTITGNEWGEDITCGFNALGIALNSLFLAIALSFNSRYSFNAVPSWRYPQIQSVATNIENLINKNLSYVSGSISTDGDNWAYRPNDAYNNTINRINELTPSEELSVGLKKLIHDLKIPVAISPASNCQDAIIQCTRLAAIAKLIDSLKDKVYLTSNEAYKDRELIIGALRSEINAASNVGSHELIKAMYELEKTYLADYLMRTKSLAPIVTHYVNVYSNSISLAHEFYGDGSRFKEIESLNPHLTPLFMIGNVYAAAR